MSPIIKVGACQHPLGDTAFHCAPLFPQSPEGALLVSQNIVAGGTHLIWSQVDEHALQGTELSEEGRGLRWTLEQGPRRGRETWMGGLNEKGKEILVPKCSQALFTGLFIWFLGEKFQSDSEFGNQIFSLEFRRKGEETVFGDGL